MTAADIDVDRLTVYLRDRWPDRAGLRVDEVHRIVGGMSRRTHFVDLSWDEPDGPRTQTVNLRTDHQRLNGFTVPLSYEFEILRRLRATTVPVAEPYWYETDPDLIGIAPFYLREVVPGSAKSKPLFVPGAEERRAELGRQLVRHLATIHTLDWESLGFGEIMTAPASPELAATVDLDHWESFFLEHEVEPRPMITEIFGRLRREQPSPPDRVSLIWGDVGIGQFIYRDDTITALTDFEMARLGDPMMDWAAAISRGLDDLLPREEAIALYESESGIRVDAERIDYCTMVAATACFCWHPLLEDLTDSAPTDAAITRLGVGLSWQWMHQANRLLTTWNPGTAL